MAVEKLELRKRLSKNEIITEIFRFSGPIILELVLMSMISMVNLSMVGHLGAIALSAAGLTNQPVLICLAVFQSFNVGATALVARFIGSGDHKDVKKVVIQAFNISIAFGLILAVVGTVVSREIVLFLGAKADTVELASMYMKFMAIGILFQSVPTAVTSILRGAGESKIPMRYNTVSNIVNVIAGFPLIYGLGFFPGMGLQGAAIATTLAKMTACIMAVYTLFTVQLPVSISLRDSYKPDLMMMRRIMNIGVSAAGEQMAMRVGFLFFTKIIADLGTVPFAAHQVCLGVTQFASNIVNGLSVAAGSLAGRSLGARNPDLAEEYCHEINKFGLAISLSIGALFFLAGYQVSRIYTSDLAVLIQSAFVLKIATVITFPQNYLSIVSGCLRGAGDTRWPLISSVIGMVVARVALAGLFVKVFHWGLGGAWTAAVADQSIRAILIYFRFKTGKWKTIAV